MKYLLYCGPHHTDIIRKSTLGTISLCAFSLFCFIFVLRESTKAPLSQTSPYNPMPAEQITLRALEPTDAQLIYTWENDPETWLVGSRQWPISMADVEALIAHSDLDIWQTRQLRFMIEATEPSATVGAIDIFDLDPLNLHCAIGVLIDKQHRRRGYATQALRLVENFAFSTLYLRTVEATIEDSNEPSRRLFLSSGYAEVGRRRDWIRHGMSWHDQIILQKINTTIPHNNPTKQ